MPKRARVGNLSRLAPRDAPDGLVVDASVEFSHIIGGLIYHVVHNLAQDGEYRTRAFATFVLVDPQQRAHNIGTGSLPADAARKTFIDVAAMLRPNLISEVLAKAAVRFQEVLMVIEAAQI